MIKILYHGIPVPKQSVRFAITKTKKSYRPRTYQTMQVLCFEKQLRQTAIEQLPKNFQPFIGAIGLEITFVFPPLKSFSQKRLRQLELGKIQYKTTKPDLTDNLMKGTMDALNGIIFKDDSQIATIHSRKIYGLVPHIEMKFYELKDEN